MMYQHQQNTNKQNTQQEQTFANLWSSYPQPAAARSNNKIFLRRGAKQPSLTPDQPLPQPVQESGDALGIQHAFWYQQVDEKQRAFDIFEQNHNSKTTPDCQDYKCREQSFKAAKLPVSRADLAIDGDDSDSFDFNEIDNEIKDTLHRSSVTCLDGADEPASGQRWASSSLQHQACNESSQSEKSQNSLCNSMVELTTTKAINSSRNQQQHVDTSSTNDSVQDCDSSSGMSSESASVPAVILPSEAVLFFDNLDNYFAEFGKVLAVNDVNDSIHVQYAERESAHKLLNALNEQQIDAKLSSGCESNFKESQQIDAQLTLKLLKISPKVHELKLKKSDSEFLKDFNSTSMHQYVSSSQLIVSTEELDECSGVLSNEMQPSLEQAYQMMASDKFSSEIGFMFAPKLSSSFCNSSGYTQKDQPQASSPVQAGSSYVAPSHTTCYKLNEASTEQQKGFNSQINPFSKCSPVFQPAQEMPIPPRMKNPFSSTMTPYYHPSPINKQVNTAAVRQGGGSNPEFTVDLDRLLSGEDRRTTIMIRHIPNKYTEEMLLKRIDRLHKGRYDFFYLPLDLNNGCNIGYAFINFVDPVYIVPFFEDMNNQSWENFNSEKICQIAFGRIQGKRHLMENVNKQSESRKVQPVVLELHHDHGQIESFRASLIAQRHHQHQQPQFAMPIKMPQQFH